VTRLTLKAHAKLNLDLRVGSRRADGYHELRTIFQTIALHDTLVIESTRKPVAVAGDASAMPLGEDNLAWKAAAALWHAMGRTGLPMGARITIRKRIPAQAGLGGGSSDAAATLAGLNRLWREPVAPHALVSLAATLGADVPFFLVGGSALGLGRGDEIYPLIDLPSRDVVIVRPSFGISTRDAYAWLADARSTGSANVVPLVAERSSEGFANDFERVVEARHPEIQEIRQRLMRLGAKAARMSGSGSAVFGVFDTPGRARRAEAQLHRPEWTVIRTRTIRRPPKQREFAAIIVSGGIVRPTACAAAGLVGAAPDPVR
jgi:4-diphosphocytidyl-2-C-methyl-D-erythritol kinase